MHPADNLDRRIGQLSEMPGESFCGQWLRQNLTLCARGKIVETGRGVDGGQASNASQALLLEIRKIDFEGDQRNGLVQTGQNLGLVAFDIDFDVVWPAELAKKTVQCPGGDLDSIRSPTGKMSNL